MKHTEIQRLADEGSVCACEFDEAFCPDNDPDFESWHFKRTCLYCEDEWCGVHCVHDGRQNSCPGCGRRPVPVRDTWGDTRT